MYILHNRCKDCGHKRDYLTIENDGTLYANTCPEHNCFALLKTVFTKKEMLFLIQAIENILKLETEDDKTDIII